MLPILTTGEQRPNRLDGGPKDKRYHARWGRYAAYDANNYLHQEWLKKTYIHKKFYKGEQWIFDEDLETFFKDESGQARNRLKLIDNIIKPIVNQYLGNAIRMKINFRAKSVSPKCINRREAKLNEMVLYTHVADRVPMMADQLRKDFPIGTNIHETKQMFNNLYVDNFTSDLNDLLVYVSENNKFEEKQRSLAENMALSGLAVLFEYEHNGHQYFRTLKSENYFWDRSAIEYDHNDAEYRGYVDFMDSPNIFEDYPAIDQRDRKAIEKYAVSYQKNWMYGTENQTMFGGKIPVIRVYWRDTEKYTYGYVRDEYGYPYLTRINYTYEGEEKPRYTDKDVITVNSERSRKVLRGKKTRDLYADEMRYCVFIPQEVISTVDGLGDIVLDYGILPYQETDNLDISSVKYPFKSYCWGYLDGEVVSPVDDAISPQRFINRLRSVAENQINNSGGAGMIYDKDLLDADDGEEKLLASVNQSKPVGLSLRGRGVQNSIGSYDNTFGKGVGTMYDIMNLMKEGVKTSTGVNEALQGESMGGDQLVGVTQLMIQRGSLMQEPFYYALTNIYLQAYQTIASVGKRIYADNDREIAIAVGDDGAKILKISKDMKTEDFRVFIKRENSQELLVESANNMMITLLQLRNADGTPFIDKQVFANLWNRSTPDDVARALRDSAKVDVEKERMQTAQVEQQTAKSQEEEGANRQQALMMQAHLEDREDQKEAHQADNEIDKIFAKGMVDSVRQGTGQKVPGQKVSLK